MGIKSVFSSLFQFIQFYKIIFFTGIQFYKFGKSHFYSHNNYSQVVIVKKFMIKQLPNQKHFKLFNSVNKWDTLVIFQAYLYCNHFTLW